MQARIYFEIRIRPNTIILVVSPNRYFQEIVYRYEIHKLKWMIEYVRIGKWSKQFLVDREECIVSTQLHAVGY